MCNSLVALGKVTPPVVMLLFNGWLSLPPSGFELAHKEGEHLTHSKGQESIPLQRLLQAFLVGGA